MACSTDGQESWRYQIHIQGFDQVVDERDPLDHRPEVGDIIALRMIGDKMPYYRVLRSVDRTAENGGVKTCELWVERSTDTPMPE